MPTVIDDTSVTTRTVELLFKENEDKYDMKSVAGVLDSITSLYIVVLRIMRDAGFSITTGINEVNPEAVELITEDYVKNHIKQQRSEVIDFVSGGYYHEEDGEEYYLHQSMHDFEIGYRRQMKVYYECYPETVPFTNNTLYRLYIESMSYNSPFRMMLIANLTAATITFALCGGTMNIHPTNGITIETQGVVHVMARIYKEYLSEIKINDEHSNNTIFDDELIEEIEKRQPRHPVITEYKKRKGEWDSEA